jgi:hypothetical protein
MSGYRNKMRDELAKRDDSVIKDASDLKFRLDKKGKLSFEPVDGNWKVRTFRRSDASFHIAEAEKFYKIGSYGEALSIWKAASFLLQLNDRDEFERNTALKALHSMDQFKEKHAFYREIDEQTEPAVLFDDRFGRTHIFSDKVRLHVVLPGAWSYARPKNKFSSDYRAVYLRHAEHELTITWEIPRGINQFGDPLDNFVYLWDYRQSLDERIKRMNGFIRNEIPVERCNLKISISREERCVAYESQMRNMKFYQYFLLKKGHGIYMIYKNPDPEDAKKIMRFIAENSRI